MQGVASTLTLVGSDVDSGSAWATLGVAAGRAAWYAGFLVIPSLVFVVAISSFDLLHAPYALILSVYFFRRCDADIFFPSATTSLI